MKIIVDTNILLDSVKFGVDIFHDLAELGTPVTTDFCVEELKRLDRKEANLALRIIKHAKIKIINTSKLLQQVKPVDEKIVEIAKLTNSAVATNDKELIKRLKMNKIKVFRLRQKKYLSPA